MAEMTTHEAELIRSQFSDFIAAVAYSHPEIECPLDCAGHTDTHRDSHADSNPPPPPPA